jgi:hypothetical protein
MSTKKKTKKSMAGGIFGRGILLGVLFCFCFSSMASADSEGILKKVSRYLFDSPVVDVATGGYDVYRAPEGERMKTGGKVVGEYAVEALAVSKAVPVAVHVASATGMTASTGTAISALSGAAATSATLAAVGGPGSAALAIIGVTAAPAVVGSVLVTGAAVGIVKGVKWLVSD